MSKNISCKQNCLSTNKKKEEERCFLLVPNAMKYDLASYTKKNSFINYVNPRHYCQYDKNKNICVAGIS